MHERRTGQQLPENQTAGQRISVPSEQLLSGAENDIGGIDSRRTIITAGIAGQAVEDGVLKITYFDAVFE
jgi:hypothetical protein